MFEVSPSVSFEDGLSVIAGLPFVTAVHGVTAHVTLKNVTMISLMGLASYGSRKLDTQSATLYVPEQRRAVIDLFWVDLC
jgi:hypothetical protein